MATIREAGITGSVNKPVQLDGPGRQLDFPLIPCYLKLVATVISRNGYNYFGGVRPPLLPRHDTTTSEELTPVHIQPPRQAKEGC